MHQQMTMIDTLNQKALDCRGRNQRDPVQPPAFNVFLDEAADWGVDALEPAAAEVNSLFWEPERS